MDVPLSLDYVNTPGIEPQVLHIEPYLWKDCAMCARSYLAHRGIHTVTNDLTFTQSVSSNVCFDCEHSSEFTGGRDLKKSKFSKIVETEAFYTCVICFKEHAKIILFTRLAAEDIDINAIKKGWLKKNIKGSPVCLHCFQLHWANEDGTVPEHKDRGKFEGELLYVKHNKYWNALSYEEFKQNNNNHPNHCDYCGCAYKRGSHCEHCTDVGGEDLVCTSLAVTNIIGVEPAKCCQCGEVEECHTLRTVLCCCSKKICVKCLKEKYVVNETGTLLHMKCHISKLQKNAYY